MTLLGAILNAKLSMFILLKRLVQASSIVNKNNLDTINKMIDIKIGNEREKNQDANRFVIRLMVERKDREAMLRTIKLQVVGGVMLILSSQLIAHFLNKGGG